MKLRAFVAIVLTLLFSPAWAEPQTLVLNSANYPPITSPAKDGVLDLIYQELARRAGIHIVIQAMPAAERALINENEGVDDGDVSRILGLEEKYPNLMRVPEAVMHYEMVAFSRSVDFTVAGPASLKPYHVGIPRGWKILERNAAEALSVTPLETGEQLFNMLNLDRIDVALIEKLQGLGFIKSQGLKGIKVLQPPMVEGDWFLYLNKKHQALIPVLAAELKKMKEDGTHQRLFASVLKRYAE